MTTNPLCRAVFRLWRSPREEPRIATENDSNGVLRRQCITEMLASGACVGEADATALMTMFPKHF